MAVRTRYIDNYITKAIEEGIKQIVIVGAGMDSRAFRYMHSFQRVNELNSSQWFF